MATRNAILSVQVLVDASKAASGVDQATSKIDKFRSGMAKAAVPAAAVGAAVVAFGKQAVDSASHLQQAMGGVEAVFGSNANQVKKWASGAADSVGLAKSEYADLATVIGSQLKNAGQPMDQVAKKTDGLITLGADLAATYGGTTADAVSALSAALKGEFDPMERYGASLTASAVSAQMAADGTDKLTGKQASAAKQAALLKLITDQTSDAQGQYAAQLNTTAEQQQRQAAQWENAKAALGTGLLPIVTAVTSKFADMANWIGQNTQAVTIIIGVIAGLAAAILAVNAAFAVWTAATRVAAAVQWLLNTALLSNPVTWLVAGIIALIAAVVLLWKKNEGFRNFVMGMWKAIRTAAVAAWNGVKAAVMAVVSWMKSFISGAGKVITGIWKGIRAAATAVFRAIKSVANSVISWITSFIRIQIRGWQIIFRAFKAAVSAVWNAIKNVARSVWNGIKSIIVGVVNGIRNVIQRMKNSFSNVFNGIKSLVTRVFNSIKSVATRVLNALLKPIDLIAAGFDKVVSVIQSVIGWISRIKFPEPPAWMKSIGSGISNIFSAPTPQAAASPRLRAGRGLARVAGVSPALSGRALTSSSGGGMVNITVNGALDPDAVARQIDRILRQRDRRTGVTVVGRTAAMP